MVREVSVEYDASSALSPVSEVSVSELVSVLSSVPESDSVVVLSEPELLLDEGLTYKAGRRAAKRLLQLDQLPDAVVSASDAAALGLMHTLLEEGILAGRDISVMGFDNNSIAEYYNPALTTVAQPQLEIGQRAMELLLKNIKNPECPEKQLLLPHQLVIRDSVRLLGGK